MALWEAWEDQADAWIEWARRPDHDGFWDGTWPQLSALIPSQSSLVVELGCGEGRVGRQLLALDHRVIGVERSPTLARAAGRHPTRLAVVQADAAHLPMHDRCTDVAVACMSLHNIDELDAAVDEAWRVLRQDGCLCVALVHPFATAQDPATMHTERPVVTAPYLTERRFEDHLERDGLAMTFVDMHRPLSTYLSALFSAGFVLEALREFGAKPIPWLMVMRARKLATRAH